MKANNILLFFSMVLLTVSCSNEFEPAPIPPIEYDSELLESIYAGDHYEIITVPAEGSKYSDIITFPGLLIGAGVLDHEPDYKEIRLRGFDGWHHHTIYNYTKDYESWMFQDCLQDFRDCTFGDLTISGWSSAWVGYSVGSNTTGRTRYFYLEFGAAYNTPDTDELHLECQYCKEHPEEAIKENPDYLYYPANLHFKTYIIEQPPLKQVE